MRFFAARDCAGGLKGYNRRFARRPITPCGDGARRMGDWIMSLAQQYGLRTPFWRSNRVIAEPLFFIADEGALPAASLFFTPTNVDTLTGANGRERYDEGSDFVIDAAARKVTLKEGSRIPFLKRSELFRPAGQPLSIGHRAGHPDQMLYFSEGAHFHHMQAAITYSHDERWSGFVPPCQRASLPNVSAKLAARKELRVFVIGDSITAGANASKKTGAYPFLPSYPELFAEVLEAETGCPVRFWNYAVGGLAADHGVRLIDEIIGHAPDLLLIAYGMNDAAQNNPDLFRQRIGEILSRTEAACPTMETILVSPMRGNPDWVATPAERFAPIRDVLASFCRTGRALCDMTSLWNDMLRFKTFHDLTGNGVNHPNDFGHRLYADALLDCILGA